MNISNRYFASYFLTFFVVTLLNAGSQEEIFLRANKLYSQGDFGAACKLYASLESKFSAVWENMGNCAFYEQDFQNSLVYWLRAQQQADAKRYGMLAERLAKVRHILDLSDESPWYSKIESWFVIHMRSLPLWFWQLLFILSWSFLFVAGPLLFRNWRLIGSCLLGLTIFCGILNYIQYKHEQRRFAIVMIPNAFLHTGTDEKLPVVATVKLGQKLRVVDMLQDWYRVSVMQCTGWIHKDKIKAV